MVVARERAGGDKRLVAYVIGKEGFDREEIIAYLQERLPEYMIPGAWVELTELPLTPNAKIDRKALPDPDDGGLSRGQYVAPVTETEKTLVKIWEELLEVERVGVEDDFFQLGGDSINIISLVSRLRKVFDRDLKLFDIYQAGTIDKIAGLIDDRSGEQRDKDEVYEKVLEEMDRFRDELLCDLPGKDEIEDIYPMSAIQNGMIYSSLLNPELAIYHDQLVYQLPGDLDKGTFIKALSLLVDKHSMLRTAFDLDSYVEGLQLVYRSLVVEVEVEEVVCAGEKEAAEYMRDYLGKRRKIPFDLKKAPLWRAAFIKLHGYTAFVFEFHHAILDGWSMASFNTEPA